MMTKRIQVGSRGIGPTASSAPRLSSALRAPHLCRCVEHAADPILQSVCNAVRYGPSLPRGLNGRRSEVKEEPAGRGTRAAAHGQLARLANDCTQSLAGKRNQPYIACAPQCREFWNSQKEKLWGFFTISLVFRLSA